MINYFEYNSNIFTYNIKHFIHLHQHELLFCFEEDNRYMIELSENLRSHDDRVIPNTFRNDTLDRR